MKIEAEKTKNPSGFWNVFPAKLCLLLLLLVSFILTYFHVIQGLIQAWANSNEYSHGFFIVPISLYVVWTKKKRLEQLESNASWLGLFVVICALLLYLVAHFAEILTIVSFSMVLFFAGVILFFYGFEILRELSFPLVLLLFMIPIPSQIYSMATVPLQLFVSKISVMVATFADVPVYREGNVIHLPSRTLEVVQACSGLRSLITLLALGYVVAYFTLRSNLLRCFLFLSAVPVAVFVNIVRVLIIIIAFYYFNIDLTAESTHTIYGLVIFILALVTLMALKGVFSLWDNSAT